MWNQTQERKAGQAKGKHENEFRKGGKYADKGSLGMRYKEGKGQTVESEWGNDNTVRFKKSW